VLHEAVLAKHPYRWSNDMKTITLMSALALLAAITACSSSNQSAQQQCSPYDPQCRISQAPGLDKLLPADQSIQQMRQIPATQ
jgi:hypothetical protein